MKSFAVVSMLSPAFAARSVMTPAIGAKTCGGGADLLARAEVRDRRCEQAEQFQPRSGALDRRQLAVWSA
jgi:hypothetical protein